MSDASVPPADAAGPALPAPEPAPKVLAALRSEMPAASLAQADVPPSPPSAADHTLLHHLGMPFYYRHTPGPAMRRGIFWSAFLIITGIVLLNLIYMPYGRESLAYHIRLLFFGGGPGYYTFEAGARGIFNQFFVIALILSGIIAPLFATFSLSNERVWGTMEFLRLAPLSTTGIVVGKMFSSVYMIHLISGTLLILGFPLGVLGGHSFPHVAFALASIVMSCALVTAAGAYLATQTMAFRGFGAVVGLLALGFFMHVFPIPLGGEQVVSFVGLLSPWGTMDQLFWHDLNSRWRAPTVPMLAGSSYLAYVYILAFQALLFVLFVRAASQKLDSSENTALNRTGWMVLWSAVVLCALGCGYNQDPTKPRDVDHCWEAATGIVLLAGLAVCVLALIDHPFRRERTLSDECERLAGRGEAMPARRKFHHAAFVTMLVLLTCALGTSFLSKTSAMKDAEDLLVLALNFLPALLALYLGLAIETSSIRYRTFVGQGMATIVISLVLFVCMLAPVIHAGTLYGRFQRCFWVAEYARAYLKNKNNPNRYYYDQFESMRKDPEFNEFLKDLDTIQVAQEMQQAYGSKPIFLFWRYRPEAFIYYPLLFVGVLAGLLVWRKRAYALLRIEAEKAVMPGTAGQSAD